MEELCRVLWLRPSLLLTCVTCLHVETLFFLYSGQSNCLKYFSTLHSSGVHSAGLCLTPPQYEPVATPSATDLRTGATNFTIKTVWLLRHCVFTEKRSRSTEQTQLSALKSMKVNTTTPPAPPTFSGLADVCSCFCCCSSCVILNGVTLNLSFLITGLSVLAS